MSSQSRYYRFLTYAINSGIWGAFRGEGGARFALAESAAAALPYGEQPSDAASRAGPADLRRPFRRGTQTMRPNLVKEKWRNGQPAIGGWLSIPSTTTAEIMAQQGFDWLCIDTQHGLIDYTTALPMLTAVSTSP